MNYTFKLSKRLARFRTVGLGVAFLLSGACAEDSFNEPSTTPPSADPSDLTIFPGSTTVGVDQSVQFFAVTDSSGIVTPSLMHGHRGGHHGGSGAIVRLAMTPEAATVVQGGTSKFQATAMLSDGSTERPSVRWAATGGTIDTSGKYTAGRVTGAYRVIATAANGVADSAAVTVTATAPAIARIELSPATAAVPPGGTQQFAAVGRLSDGSASSIAVTWSAAGGTISSSGLYTAGQAPGNYRVIATGAGKADTADATVTAPFPSPSTGVPVAPGQSIQAAVNANPAGTTFLVKAGTHVRQSVVPKSGDQFIGEAGAVMDGENVTTYAFDRGNAPYPANVVIRGLKVTRYNPPYQMGMIRAGDGATDGAANWVVRDNELSYATTGGLRLGPGMRVVGNYIHHNRAIGIVGTGAKIVVDSNEIAWNNYLKEFNWSGEAGGTKFASTDSLTVRGNYSHDNWGPGLWTDINNRYALYENNRVEDNAGPGIYHEISYDAVIRNNTIKRNGFDFAGWIWGGGIQISTSKNVEIYGNTLDDNKVGISIVAQVRGYDWATENISVHDNTVTQRSGVPAGAAADIPTSRTVYYAGIKFLRNAYRVKSAGQTFEWADACCKTWAQWQGYGLDANGSLTIIP